jgi:hypothetical protein
MPMIGRRLPLSVVSLFIKALGVMVTSLAVGWMVGDDEQDDVVDDDVDSMDDWSDDDECNEPLGDFDMSFDFDTNLLSCDKDVLNRFFKSLGCFV